MDPKEMRDIIEALLFASDVPVRIRTLADVIGGEVTGKDIRDHISEMNADYEERGASFSVEDIAGGVQLLTRPDFDEYIKKLVKARQKSRLSRAGLETLAIIAYRQPLTRPEMEAIRGVDCGGVSQTLLERGLIKIAGRSEAVGRPLLYATTPAFLEHFGLKSVAQLPSIDELVAQMDTLTLATDMARELGGEPEEFAVEIDARLHPAPPEPIEDTADTGGEPDPEFIDDATSDASPDASPDMVDEVEVDSEPEATVEESTPEPTEPIEAANGQESEPPLEPALDPASS